MQEFLGQITLVNILSVLLLIASIWLLIIILQKRTGYMFRGMIFLLFVLLALIYFQQSNVNKFTLSDFRYVFSPKRSFTLNYRKDKDTHQDTIARYVFDDPKPRISVSMDANGKYFHITNITVINKILSRLGLPRLSSGAQELVSITGSNSHKNLYRWEDYPRGILIIEREICKNKATLETYNCLGTITIRKKYR
jgi:hypothetical protein